MAEIMAFLRKRRRLIVFKDPNTTHFSRLSVLYYSQLRTLDSSISRLDYLKKGLWTEVGGGQAEPWPEGPPSPHTQ